MIIAFDGNVFVGKTSLIEALSSLCSAIVVNEHGQFLDTNISTHVVTEKEMAIFLQSKYFDAEEKRCVCIEKKQINFLDRSFVSMAAHVFALNLVSGIDIREWFLQEIQKRIKLGKVIIPDLFCFVRCDHKIINKRIAEDNSRGTDSVYFSEKYFGAIESLNKAWSDKVGGLMVDTSAVLPIRLAETLIPQISTASQGVFSTQNINDFLREVLT